MNKIAIFASGSGTNAERLIRYFKNDPEVEVVLVLSNRGDAPVLQRARNLSVPVRVFDRNVFYQSSMILEELNELGVSLILLAGFLWLIPGYLIDAYPGRIMNIHPALLPSFGGRGMYGERVHEAVLASGAGSSGITIHLVDREYDHGEIIFRAECPVMPGDTPSSLAARIHELEHRHYPEVVKKYLTRLNRTP